MPKVERVLLLGCLGHLKPGKPSSARHPPNKYVVSLLHGGRRRREDRTPTVSMTNGACIMALLESRALHLPKSLSSNLGSSCYESASRSRSVDWRGSDSARFQFGERSQVVPRGVWVLLRSRALG